MKFLLWIRAQLQDPTNTLHAIGICTLAGEVVKHWLSGQPVDPGTIAAGMGSVTIGGVMDHYQAKLGQ